MPIQHTSNIIFKIITEILSSNLQLCQDGSATIDGFSTLARQPLLSDEEKLINPMATLEDVAWLYEEFDEDVNIMWRSSTLPLGLFEAGLEQNNLGNTIYLQQAYVYLALT